MIGPEPGAATGRVPALLREAHLLRMRGRHVEAEEKVREATSLAPDDPAALEMLGDLLAEKGTLDEAAEAYRRARERAPERAALEEKHARLVLLLAEQEDERKLALLQIENPAAYRFRRRRRSPVRALALSAVWPGLGQIYNGEYVKGGLFMAGSFLTFLLGGEALLRLLFAASGSRVSPSGIEATFGLLSVLLWTAAVVDAPVRARRTRG